MDDFTYAALSKLALPNLTAIRLVEIENDELRLARETRTIGEYCWTCTTPLLRYVMAQCGEGEIVSYVDADMLFFSDPMAVISEMGSNSIYIHEHSFAPEHAGLEAASGRFNVGLVAFRNDLEGRTCLERWYNQCIGECVMDPAAGKCGDQNYLDEWPALYSGLVVSNNPGVGLAPWNISKHEISAGSDGPAVDGKPVVFYHYHSLRLLRKRFGVLPIAMAVGAYAFGESVVREIYRPYAIELWKATRYLKRYGYDIMMAVPTVPSTYGKVLNRQYLFHFASYSFAPERNVKTLKALYGIDADREVL